MSQHDVFARSQNRKPVTRNTERGFRSNVALKKRRKDRSTKRKISRQLYRKLRNDLSSWCGFTPFVGQDRSQRRRPETLKAQVLKRSCLDSAKNDRISMHFNTFHSHDQNTNCLDSSKNAQIGRHFNTSVSADQSTNCLGSPKNNRFGKHSQFPFERSDYKRFKFVKKLHKW